MTVLTELGSALRVVRPSVVLTLGWVVTMIYGFPGILTLDGFDQLREGRHGVYTDGHPPVMAVLWGVIDRVIPGPLGMYVLQTSLWLFGLHGVLRHAFSARRAAWIAVAVALFPPVLAPMGVVWKDALMAAFLMVGAAGLLHERRAYRVLALVPIFLATAVRYNAPAATLPLVVLLFAWTPMTTGWRALGKRYAIAVAVWVTLTASAIALNAAWTDKPMHYWYSTVVPMDIAGTLSRLPVDLSDDELRPILEDTQPLVTTNLHAALRAAYVPWNFTTLVSGERRIWSVPLIGDTPVPPAQRAALGRAWRQIVSSYPQAYLDHRIATFAEVIGLPRKHRGTIVQKGRGQLEANAVFMGLSPRNSALQHWMHRKVGWVSKRTPLFRPWIYLLLAIVLVALSRRSLLVFALACSGIALELSLFPLAGTPDYRYSHWLVSCTLLAAILLIGSRARGRAARQAD